MDKNSCGTALASVERETRGALAYAQSIVETIREALVVLTSDLHVKTANRAFYRTFRVTPEETEGRYFYELGAGQWRVPTLVKLLEEILPQKSVIEGFEVETEFPSIGYRVMLLNARQLHMSEAKESGLILLAVEDVTERKEAEKELRMLNAKLERSNRELQDFAQVASHDLQEPMRKILAFGDRLKTKDGGALSEQGRDYLERMQSAAHRMQRLINDLLSFSRVTTKVQPFAPVDLRLLMRDVLSDLEVPIEGARASVEVGVLPLIEADAIQIRQLLQNLISNALKYQRPGVKPIIKVRSEILQDRRQEAKDPYAADGTLCQLFVEDNGIGFDEKYLDRIFTIFERLHGRKEYEGTGVGLAICRRIVERHGGHITAHSKPGEGATFIVTIPFRQRKESGRNE